MAQMTNAQFHNDDLQHCKQLLANVSRTFALNIKILEGDLFKSVLLGYLLCRIIDTVEDCADKDPEWKIPLLLEFPGFLENSELENFGQWIDRSLEGTSSPADRQLLEESARVLRGYWSLPENLRLHTKTLINEMSFGMAKYIHKFSAGSEIILKDRVELEDYCYYVAGTVGLFLTSSFQDYYKMPELISRELKKNAVSFGLGLQLTNIAKDLLDDRKRGWTYLPLSYLEKYSLSLKDFNEFKSHHHRSIQHAYLDLLDDSLAHLKNALEYSLAIPVHHIRLRMFCLWPLWMALETLVALKDQHNDLMKGKVVKISRTQVKEIMAKTTLMSPFDDLLRKDFAKKIEIYEALSPIG